ncbi:MAG: hypothetical protein ACRC17_12135 [Culicoidibacterales bacterium]
MARIAKTFTLPEESIQTLDKISEPGKYSKSVGIALEITREMMSFLNVDNPAEALALLVYFKRTHMLKISEPLVPEKENIDVIGVEERTEQKTNISKEGALKLLESLDR